MPAHSTQSALLRTVRSRHLIRTPTFPAPWRAAPEMSSLMAVLSPRASVNQSTSSVEGTSPGEPTPFLWGASAPQPATYHSQCILHHHQTPPYKAEATRAQSPGHCHGPGPQTPNTCSSVGPTCSGKGLYRLRTRTHLGWKPDLALTCSGSWGKPPALSELGYSALKSKPTSSFLMMEF